MQANEQVPTRSAMLQLREEQSIIHEAYNFLDEKRLLLAAELLRQLNQYQKLLNKYEKLQPAWIPRLGTPLVGLAAHLAGGEDAAAECFRMLLELP